MKHKIKGAGVYFDLGGTEVRNRLTRYFAQKKLKPRLSGFDWLTANIWAKGAEKYLEKCSVEISHISTRYKVVGFPPFHNEFAISDVAKSMNVYTVLLPYREQIVLFREIISSRTGNKNSSDLDIIQPKFDHYMNSVSYTHLTLPTKA